MHNILQVTIYNEKIQVNICQNMTIKAINSTILYITSFYKNSK